MRQHETPIAKLRDNAGERLNRQPPRLGRALVQMRFGGMNFLWLERNDMAGPHRRLWNR